MIKICPHQVHACRTIILFFPRGLRPPTGRRKRGLVWLSSVSTTSHVEDDAQHWWWVLSTLKKKSFKEIALHHSGNILIYSSKFKNKCYPIIIFHKILFYSQTHDQHSISDPFFNSVFKSYTIILFFSILFCSTIHLYHSFTLTSVILVLLSRWITVCLVFFQCQLQLSIKLSQSSSSCVRSWTFTTLTSSPAPLLTHTGSSSPKRSKVCHQTVQLLFYCMKTKIRAKIA